MQYRIFLSALFLLLIPGLAQAEYRVFLLKIARSEQDFRLVESTLDPMQYRYIYQVMPDEQVTYTDTWRCYGRTDGFKEFCPNPKGQIPPEGAATP